MLTFILIRIDNIKILVLNILNLWFLMNCFLNVGCSFLLDESFKGCSWLTNTYIHCCSYFLPVRSFCFFSVSIPGWFYTISGPVFLRHVFNIRDSFQFHIYIYDCQFSICTWMSVTHLQIGRTFRKIWFSSCCTCLAELIFFSSLQISISISSLGLNGHFSV